MKPFLEHELKLLKEQNTSIMKRRNDICHPDSLEILFAQRSKYDNSSHSPAAANILNPN